MSENPFDTQATTEAPRPAESRPSQSASLTGKAEDIFRGMWASLFYSGRATGNTVLVTSAGRREGSTTIACGLALSGSGPSTGARVCLVDFNVRNPAVHKLLGLRQGPGLTDVVTTGSAPAQVAQRINQNLDVISIGTADDGSDILRGEAIRKLLAGLAESYDYVLVDAAAVNASPDAQVLGGLCKQAVLVVNSDQTPREAVAQAKKRLESGGAKLAGVVLNLRTFPIPNFLYKRV